MMKNRTNAFKNVEKLGDKYCEKFLDGLDKESLENNWWEALKFFFDHSFARGRRDELSIEYRDFTINTLEDYFSINSKNADFVYAKFKENKSNFDTSPIIEFKKTKKARNCINHAEFNQLTDNNPILDILTAKKQIILSKKGKKVKKNISLNNDADVLMVLDVLKFVLDDDKKNIYNYIKNTIVTKSTENIYKELTGLSSIGDKLASFILRDIGLMNPGIVKDEYDFAFPVDTWVSKIASEMGCTGDYFKIKACLIEECINYEIYPLKFAAGMWCLGSHSFEILMKHFGDIKL